MIAWIGGRIRLAVRMVIGAVRMANDGQVHLWECVLFTSGTVPATAIGPLLLVTHALMFRVLLRPRAG